MQGTTPSPYEAAGELKKKKRASGEVDGSQDWRWQINKRPRVTDFALLAWSGSLAWLGLSYNNIVHHTTQSVSAQPSADSELRVAGQCHYKFMSQLELKATPVKTQKYRIFKMAILVMSCITCFACNIHCQVQLCDQQSIIWNPQHMTRITWVHKHADHEMRCKLSSTLYASSNMSSTISRYHRVWFAWKGKRVSQLSLTMSLCPHSSGPAELSYQCWRIMSSTSRYCRICVAGKGNVVVSLLDHVLMSLTVQGQNSSRTNAGERHPHWSHSRAVLMPSDRGHWSYWRMLVGYEYVLTRLSLVQAGMQR